MISWQSVYFWFSSFPTQFSSFLNYNCSLTFKLWHSTTYTEELQNSFFVRPLKTWVIQYHSPFHILFHPVPVYIYRTIFSALSLRYNITVHAWLQMFSDLRQSCFIWPVTLYNCRSSISIRLPFSYASLGNC